MKALRVRKVDGWAFDQNGECGSAYQVNIFDQPIRI
jgi:hypothetical protein